MNERDKKLFSAALAITLAAAACSEAAPSLTPVPTEGPTTTEFVPASEVDASYSGVVLQQVDINVKNDLAATTGYPESYIGGYTFSIDRGVTGQGEFNVHFGIAPESVFDSTGQKIMVSRDFIYSEDFPDGKLPLYRSLIDSPVGGDEPWVELSISTYDGPVIGELKAVVRYPANTMQRYEDGLDTQILFYPPDNMKQTDLAGVSNKPIALLYKGKPLGQPADLLIPTPFSDVREIGYRNDFNQPKPDTGNPLPPASAPTPMLPTEVIKATIQYDASNAEVLKNIGIPVYEIPADDPFNGNFQNWLKETQSKPFSDKAKTIPLRSWGNQDWVTYDPSTEPNFPDPDSKPFRLGVVAGHLVSGQIEYLLLPIEYKSENGQSDWIVTAFVIKDSTGKLSQSQIKERVKQWSSAKYPAFIFSTDHSASTYQGDDLILKSQKMFPNWKNLTGQFILSGNAKSLSQPGLIFDTIINSK